MNHWDSQMTEKVSLKVDRASLPETRYMVIALISFSTSTSFYDAILCCFLEKKYKSIFRILFTLLC